jgi:hypothetical protein
VRRGAALAAAALALAPGLALACPACALRGGPGAGVLALVGGMIAVPYLVAVVAIRLVRKIDRIDNIDKVDNVEGIDT